MDHGVPDGGSPWTNVGDGLQTLMRNGPSRSRPTSATLACLGRVPSISADVRLVFAGDGASTYDVGAPTTSQGPKDLRSLRSVYQESLGSIGLPGEEDSTFIPLPIEPLDTTPVGLSTELPASSLSIPNSPPPSVASPLPPTSPAPVPRPPSGAAVHRAPSGRRTFRCASTPPTSLAQITGAVAPGSAISITSASAQPPPAIPPASPDPSASAPGAPPPLSMGDQFGAPICASSSTTVGTDANAAAAASTGAATGGGHNIRPSSAFLEPSKPAVRKLLPPLMRASQAIVEGVGVSLSLVEADIVPEGLPSDGPSVNGASLNRCLGGGSCPGGGDLSTGQLWVDMLSPGPNGAMAAVVAGSAGVLLSPQRISAEFGGESPPASIVRRPLAPIESSLRASAPAVATSMVSYNDGEDIEAVEARGAVVVAAPVLSSPPVPQRRDRLCSSSSTLQYNYIQTGSSPGPGCASPTAAGNAGIRNTSMPGDVDGFGAQSFERATAPVALRAASVGLLPAHLRLDLSRLRSPAGATGGGGISARDMGSPHGGDGAVCGPNSPSKSIDRLCRTLSIGCGANRSPGAPSPGSPLPPILDRLPSASVRRQASNQ